MLLTAATMLVGAVVNVASIAIAAATTGQKYTWADAAIAAGTGAIAAWNAGIGAAVGGGLSFIKSAFFDNRSMGASIAIGVTTAVGTFATFSNIAGLKKTTKIGTEVSKIAADGVFSVGYNCSAAALTRPRTSGSSKKKTETTKVSKAKSKTSKSRQRFEQRRYWNRALRQWRYYYVKV